MQWAVSRITDRYIISNHFISFFVLFCFTFVLILFFFLFVQFCSVLFFSAFVLFLFYFMLLWMPYLMIQRTAPRERTWGDSTEIQFAQMGRFFLFCISSASVLLPFCFCSVAVLFHTVVVAAPNDPEGKDLRRFHRTVTIR